MVAGYEPLEIGHRLRTLRDRQQVTSPWRLTTGYGPLNPQRTRPCIRSARTRTFVKSLTCCRFPRARSSKPPPPSNPLLVDIYARNPGTLLKRVGTKRCIIGGLKVCGGACRWWASTTIPSTATTIRSLLSDLVKPSSLRLQS